MRSEPNWRVLLIGGSSGAGKTTVAQAIARRFGLSVLMTDDIRLAIQQTTTPEQHPAFHFLATPAIANRQPPEAIRDGLIAVSEAMTNALAIVIAHHVVVPGAGRLLIEGDNVLPHMVTQHRFPDLRYFTGLVLSDEVRSVFLHEPDEAVLLTNMHERGRGFADLTVAEQQTAARASWLHGQWLRAQCAEFRVPLVLAQPRATIVERIIQRIGEASPPSP